MFVGASHRIEIGPKITLQILTVNRKWKIDQIRYIEIIMIRLVNGISNGISNLLQVTFINAPTGPRVIRLIHDLIVSDVPVLQQHDPPDVEHSAVDFPLIDIIDESRFVGLFGASAERGPIFVGDTSEAIRLDLVHRGIDRATFSGGGGGGRRPAPALSRDGDRGNHCPTIHRMF